MTQIVIDVPYLTIKEFSRRTGMNTETIKKKISAGLIPTMKRKSTQQKALINMVALTKQALAEANAERICSGSLQSNKKGVREMINEKILLNDAKRHETHLLIHQTFVHLTERAAHSQQNQVRQDDVQQVKSTERKAHAPAVLTAVPFEQLALQAIFDYLGSNGSYQEISLLIQKLTEILANGATNASNGNKSSSY